MEKLILKHLDYCDSCRNLGDVITIGGHRKCGIFNKPMTPDANSALVNMSAFEFPRPEYCKKKYEAERKK